jgi:hypothetical protein
VLVQLSSCQLPLLLLLLCAWPPTLTFPRHTDTDTDTDTHTHTHTQENGNLAPSFSATNPFSPSSFQRTISDSPFHLFCYHPWLGFQKQLRLPFYCWSPEGPSTLSGLFPEMACGALLAKGVMILRCVLHFTKKKNQTCQV